MYKSIITAFFALIANFIFILCLFFVPVINQFFMGSKVFLIPFAVFFLLGLVLTILVFKSKIKGKLKKFLLLTGISAFGMFAAILLHNLIYGTFIYIFGDNIWDRIGTGDEPIFFFIGIIICPLGFLIGAIGSIAVLIKDKNKK